MSGGRGPGDRAGGGVWDGRPSRGRELGQETEPGPGTGAGRGPSRGLGLGQGPGMGRRRAHLEICLQLLSAAPVLHNAQRLGSGATRRHRVRDRAGASGDPASHREELVQPATAAAERTPRCPSREREGAATEPSQGVSGRRSLGWAVRCLEPWLALLACYSGTSYLRSPGPLSLLDRMTSLTVGLLTALSYWLDNPLFGAPFHLNLRFDRSLVSS